jgi:limonene-1,2-epoxide hydrolase
MTRSSSAMAASACSRLAATARPLRCAVERQAPLDRKTLCPQARLHGREALRAEIERQLGYVAWTHCGLMHIMSDERRGITERADRFCKNGHVVSHAPMAVYELDADSLLTAWRECFDTWPVAPDGRRSGAPVGPGSAGPRLNHSTIEWHASPACLDSYAGVDCRGNTRLDLTVPPCYR